MTVDVPIDPFEIKRFSKLHPYRLTWTTYSRLLDFYGRATYKPIASLLDTLKPLHVILERGTALPDTAIGTSKSKLLELAVEATEHFSEPIVEIGCYRGATTRQLASATKRQVYAVDPYIGYGGGETDLESFQAKTHSLANVRHLRQTSGQAFSQQNQLFSLVFIDAITDFSNTWFNFVAWSSLVRQDGLIAIDSVDDWKGVNLAGRKILSQTESFSVWGYCPDLVVVQKKF